MRERWRHLSANARFGRLRVILIVLLVATVSVVPPVVGGAPYLVFAVAGPLGLVLPYFIREVLVDHDAPKVILRWAGPAIVISLGVFREQIKGEAAHGGYLKAGGEWDGSAGNSYGYPASERPEEDCYGFGFSDSCTLWESCSYPCTLDADCPAENVGSAVPECREKADVGTPGIVFAEERLCVLPCATNADCPEGMACISHPYGFGVICMWEW